MDRDAIADLTAGTGPQGSAVMIIVTSEYGSIGIPPAMQILRDGGTALDAVEAAIRTVESNPDDHTVGLGGLPNLLGNVELDASIMDGRTLRAGAVGSLQGYEHPISVARKVMEELPHVLIVGVCLWHSRAGH